MAEMTEGNPVWVKFLEAMNSGKDLMDAFKVLSQGEETASVTAGMLRQAMKKNVKLTDAEVAEVVNKVLGEEDKKKCDWNQITFQQFESIVNEIKVWVKFLEAMNSGKDPTNAFKVLIQGEETASVTARMLRRAMEKKVKLTYTAVDEVVNEVLNKEDKEKCIWNQITSQQFESIVKKLEAPAPVMRKLAEINKAVDNPEIEWVVLYGSEGVGKTWMAREVARRAISKGDFAVWIYPESIYNEGFTLLESIAYQLRLMLAFHKWVAEYATKHGGQEQQKEAKKGDEERDEKTNRENMVTDKLKKMIRHTVSGKRLLLVFDDYQGSVNPVEERSDLKAILGLDKETYKVLITRTSRETLDLGTPIEVMVWTRDDARAFLAANSGDDDVIEEKEGLAEFFIGKTGMLPAECLIIARTVDHLWGKDDSGQQKLRCIKEETERETVSSKDMIQKLITESDLIPRRILIDGYSSRTAEKHFMNKGKRGIANFNELISYWMIEGLLGEFDRMQDAYDEGYRVVTELLNFGLLRKVDDSYVMKSCEWKFDFNIREYYDFFGDLRLGMGYTFYSKLGRIALADGIMRTVAFGQEDEKLKAGDKMTTLMLDGNHLELPENDFFNQPVEELSKKGYLEPQLEILAVFNPTIKPFPLPLEKLQNLRLLVLRGCRFLNKFEEVFEWCDETHAEESPPGDRQSEPPQRHTGSVSLGHLEVLEISGPKSPPSPLDTLHDFFFKSMPKLKSVNLSSLSIESLPDSFYDLERVEYLILKDNLRLKILKGLEKFRKLQLLDVSGSTSLERFVEKNFVANKELEVINFSKTHIDRIPLIRSLEKSITLTLSDCDDLRGIRKVDNLNCLQILNLSNAKKIEELLDPTIQRLDSIEILDVSGTSIRRLPGCIGNPYFLYMKNCEKLKELLPLRGPLKDGSPEPLKLQELDVSGSCNLKDVKKKFLENMKSLKVLNLSRTGIECLPSLDEPLKLRTLLLSNCESLKNLDGLSSMVELKELEKLDLSGCKNLVEINEGTFENMEQLHTLNLSDLQLDKLPSLSMLHKLKKLDVKDCPNLTDLPRIEDLMEKALEELDHSGTTLKSLPHVDRECKPKLKVTGPIAPSFYFDPQKLLKDLGAADDVESVPSGAVKADLQEEVLNQCNWKIFSWRCGANASQETLGSSGVHFLHLLNMCPSLLEENFHFLIVPNDARIKLPDKSSYIDDSKVRGFFFKPVSTMDMLEKCLEIRGFTKSPKFVQPLLKKAESVVLVDNPFIRCFSDLGHDGVKAIKLCWIERCNEMEYLIQPEKIDHPDDNISYGFQSLQILWFSHVERLTKVSNGNIPEFSFKNLKTLYLEFCPKLSSISSSCSQFGFLESIHIRYCQKLKTLFESAELGNLTKLHLWGLPELEKIELKAPLRELRVGDCRLLEHVLSSIPGSHDNLKTLHVRSCENVKTICGDQDLAACFPMLNELELWALPELQKVMNSMPSLATLRVGECLSLENVLVELPKELKTLEVKSCEKLRTIFEYDPPKQSEVDETCLEAVKLDYEKMELLCLPELKSIVFNRVVSLKKDPVIWGCPKLQKLSVKPKSNHGRNP